MVASGPVTPRLLGVSQRWQCFRNRTLLSSEVTLSQRGLNRPPLSPRNNGGEFKPVRDKSRVKAGLIHQTSTTVFAQQVGEGKLIRDKSRVKADLIHQPSTCASSHNNLANSKLFCDKSRVKIELEDTHVNCVFLCKYGVRRIECRKVRRRHFLVDFLARGRNQVSE